MDKQYSVTVYRFSPLDDDAVELSFTSEREMNEYLLLKVEEGQSFILYKNGQRYSESGWEQLSHSSYYPSGKPYVPDI